MWRRATTTDREDGEHGLFYRGLDDDAAGATLLGAAGPPSPDRPVEDEQRAELRAAIAELRASHASGIFSAKRTIDPLLDLWSLASAVDRSVARPVEGLLVTLVERSVVAGSELASCLDRVEAALARLGA